MNWHAPHKRRKARKKEFKENPRDRIILFHDRMKQYKRCDNAQNSKAEILYIIGNGFDLYHGLKTEYINFYKYLKRHHMSLLELMSKFYDIKKGALLWSKFEKGLKDFDPNALEENFQDYFPDYASDNFRDRDRYDIEYYVRNELEPLKDELHNAFEDWIDENENSFEVSEKKLKLDINAKFLNFNYTDILETIYGISRNNITYIHNKIRENNPLLFGHAWNPQEWSERREEIMPKDLSEEERECWLEKQSEEYDYSIERGYDAIDSFFRDIFKDCEANIQKNKDFFSDLKSIKKIYVLGHSVSEVDLPYYKKMIACIKCKKLHWFISDFEGDFQEKKQSLIDIGVSADKIERTSFSDMELSTILHDC